MPTESQREVPYYTTDDESKWCGHIWHQRRGSYGGVRGPWGFMYEVTPPYSDDPVASGWRATQESAEAAMNAALREHQND